MYRVRAQLGCTGKIQDMANTKVGVAVLDTGVAMHPDLKERIVAFRDFMGKKTFPYDDSGHGTHVCGIICGNGESSNGKFRGIAPGADLIVGKVLDNQGNGSLEAMLSGIDWVISLKEKYNIRVLNISVGLGNEITDEKQECLLEKLLEARKKDIVIVCAAGNNGPRPGSISKIGNCKEFITVGCHDGKYFRNHCNRCETYSARGEGEGSKKPDIVAPGTEILSCNYKYILNDVSETRSFNQRNPYIAKSGTSMATPIVSGTLALYFQTYPKCDSKSAIRQLLLSCDDLKEPDNKQGYGMLNIKKVLTVHV